MEFDQIFNLAEGIFWIFISLLFIYRSRKPTFFSRNNWLLGALAFFCFGVSDFIEIYSRAWYHPWWLILWKGICLITLAWIGRQYLCLKKQAPENHQPDEPPDTFPKS